MKRFATITILAAFLATPVLAADKQNAKDIGELLKKLIGR